MRFPSKRAQIREGSLDQYLKEISAYPLIDRAEEVRLAKEIRRGEEEALDKLVRSNLRFVVSVAKKYQNQGVPLSDLINEGNLGLIQAAKKYDPSQDGHDVKFITYAVWWIRRAMDVELAHQRHLVRPAVTTERLLDLLVGPQPPIAKAEPEAGSETEPVEPGKVEQRFAGQGIPQGQSG